MFKNIRCKKKTYPKQTRFCTNRKKLKKRITIANIFVLKNLQETNMKGF